MHSQIGIIGTRNASPAAVELCRQLVCFLFDQDPEAIIVTGGDDEHDVGGNIDRCAARTARALGRGTIVHLPELFPEGHPQAGKWVGRWAGVARNTLVVNDSTHGVHVFWNGISRGTVDGMSKAYKLDRLRRVYFENGQIWKMGDNWDVFAYGARMETVDTFDAERITAALLLRLQANKRSKLNHVGRNAEAPIDQKKLDYANGRAIHAFNCLIEGMRPVPGIGDQEGEWFVPSENKKKENVRPHHIDTTGRCDCDAMTRGFRPCFAMYLVWLVQQLISPSDVDVLDRVRGAE
jgi:hypothetical protein